MPDDLSAASLLVARIAECGDSVDLLHLLRRGLTLLGAEVGFFASWVKEDTTLSDCRFLLACDPRWALAYEQRDGLAADPWLRYALSRSEPVSGCAIAARSERERAVVQLARSFGFEAVVVVPAPMAGGTARGGVLVFGSSEATFAQGDAFPTLKVIARSLAMDLQEQHAMLLREAFIRKHRITDAELRMLSIAQAKRRSKALCDFDGASPGAIDARFRRLNEKLGSPSRRVTSRLASAYGLL